MNRRDVLRAGGAGLLGLTLPALLKAEDLQASTAGPPKINANISRDHWPKCYTVLLAGGGVQGGAVYGASDKYGAVPDRDPVTTGDLAATMYHASGIDHTLEVRDNRNRPLPIAKGRPVTEIFA